MFPQGSGITRCLFITFLLPKWKMAWGNAIMISIFFCVKDYYLGKLRYANLDILAER